MKQKVTKDNWEALIHWNFAFVGGFLGAYAILLHLTSADSHSLNAVALRPAFKL